MILLHDWNLRFYSSQLCNICKISEPPVSTSANCPYQYGIFADATDCSVFWSCWAGESSRYQCGPGLAYSTESRVCTWIDKVPGCEEQRGAVQK